MSIRQQIKQLTNKPIAHRGLHNQKAALIENSCSAVQAAINSGFGIEVDLRQSASNIPIIFHDKKLERMTNGLGNVEHCTIWQLKKLTLKNSSDKLQTLPELLEQVNGQVPLVLEIKSQWQKNRNFEQEISNSLRRYKGVCAVMSYDKDSIKAVKNCRPETPCGLVAQQFKSKKYLDRMSAFDLLKMRHLQPALLPHKDDPKIDFIAYDVNALPAPAPLILKYFYGLPLLTWTVRTKKQRATAKQWADAMIFEGFIPKD